MRNSLSLRQGSARARAGRLDSVLFAANFLRHPFMLGSMVPSSRFLVDRVLQPIDWQQARVVVEYGPGVGTLTSEILKRMRHDACLIAIEMNGNFVRFLQKAFPDPRLQVVQGSAANVLEILHRVGFTRANYVISGIPLGSLPTAMRAEIATRSRDALEPGGLFIVYQFMSRVLPLLKRTFPNVVRSVEWRNIPPAHVFACALSSQPDSRVIISRGST
jgi:phospholipid N-methyltransferase